MTNGIRGHGILTNQARASMAASALTADFDLMTAAGAGSDLARLIGSDDVGTSGVHSAAFVSGGEGDDIFYLGATMSSDDVVDGGAGNDRLYLQGDYTDWNALTLNGVMNVEELILLSADDDSFGGGGPGPFSYDITATNANVLSTPFNPFAVFVVDARGLRPDEHLVFDGSILFYDSVLVRAGEGDDSLTGGTRSDFFEFGGNFTPQDHVDGGPSTDVLILRGDYSGSRALTLGSGSLQSTEIALLVSGHDTSLGYYAHNAMSFDSDLGDLHYEVTVTDDLVPTGGHFSFVGILRETESLMFNGSAESDGSLSVTGGDGADWIMGGSGDDQISGGGGADALHGGAGADTLSGGNGNDVFYYGSLTASPAGGSDTIMDFGRGDFIDLSAIDAIPASEEDDAFTFIGHSPFRGHAGELRVEGHAGIWVVSADVDGDRVADFEILVLGEGHRPPVRSDFEL